MWKYLKQLAITTTVLVVTIAVGTTNAQRMDCAKSQKSISDVFYYNSECNSVSCYKNYCSCIGQEFSNETDTCKFDTQNCTLKNMCGSRFLNCMGNLSEQNGTTCSSKLMAYNALGTGILFYYACESLFCNRFNVSNCTSTGNVCLDYSYMLQPSNTTIAPINMTAPVPTSSGASEIVATVYIVLATCAIALI